RYSVLYRRAIYDVLPPAQRAALWREQLEGYLAPDKPFNDAQRAAIRDAIAQLPALTANNPDRARADQVANRLYSLIDRPTVRRMIGVLGPLPTPQARAANAKRPFCDCESDYDCGGFGTCTFVQCSFDSGCGPFMGYICTGVCR
ncbi:MAG TPA: bacteriocin fulvocin C-related protein, partial [Longimicrobium sp.]